MPDINAKHEHKSTFYLKVQQSEDIRQKTKTSAGKLLLEQIFLINTITKTSGRTLTDKTQNIRHANIVFWYINYF